MMQSSPRQMLEEANRLHQSGRLREAEAIYRRILALHPDELNALHYLGLLSHQLGQTPGGLELLQRSVQLAPLASPYRFNLAMVLQETSRHQAAADEYSAVIRLKPDHADAYSRLALCLRSLNRLEEAEAAIRRAIALRPNVAQSHNNLGAILRELKRDEEAAAAFAAAIALDPSEGSAHSNLGATFCALGRLEEAERACRRGVELSGGLSLAWLNLATVLSRQRRLDEAVRCARRSIELDPQNADARFALGAALNDQGLVPEALEHLRRAIEIQPDFRAAWSTYVYTLLFDPASDPATIRREHEKWDVRFARPLMPRTKEYPNVRDPDRRLRLGYVGPTFRTHVVGLYLQPVLESHDHNAFEVTCYSDVKQPDAVTHQLRRHADQWRDTAALNDEELAGQIRKDQIDVLVDLNLHMLGSRLLAFARRPAPLQVCHLGYPATTGLSAMDYAITDVHLDPPGSSDSHYVERLLRLPDSYWCYKPPQDCPPVNPLPALQAGCVTFGSLNNFVKTNENVMAVWGKILAAVPRSRLAVMLEGGAAANLTVLGNFARHGIPVERLLIFERRARAQYMAMYHQIDFALDPFPYAGHTTSFDAVWMGVPFVTLAGASSVSRAGVTVLSNLAMSDLIADSVEQYVQRSVQLAGDLNALAEIRATLRDRMSRSALTDALRYTRHLEALLRTTWRQWCGS
jgi:predicted O-linked N-acetylglucosamine transferase (SPINDLY family)